MKKMNRRKLILIVATILYVLLYVAVKINPIRTKLISLFILFSPIFFVLFVLCIFKQKVILKIIGVVTVVFLIVLVSLKNKDVPVEKIRNRYVTELLKYENTTYVWGGETRNGIDCSGLVRKGMIDTLLKVGIENVSSKYVYEAFKLYVNDFSAKAIKQEYKNLFTTLQEIESVNTFDHSYILPGDILVTNNGVHTFAYIGNNTWIQADPDSKKVIIETAPSTDNKWYKMNAVILRWGYF